MIRGDFYTSGMTRRPFIDAILQFPAVSNQSLDVKFLIDTGADRTILAPLDAIRLSRRFGLDLTTLAKGQPTTGVGGRTETRSLDATLIIDTFTTTINMRVLEVPPPPIPAIPSLLGRDVLSHFALFMEDRTNRVLLLEPHEADALNLL